MPHPLKIYLAADPRPDYVIAAAAEVHPGTLSSFLHGKAKLTDSAKERLAEVLGVPVADLFPDPVARLVADRAAQGLPPVVDDPDVLRRVAALLAGQVADGAA